MICTDVNNPDHWKSLSLRFFVGSTDTCVTQSSTLEEYISLPFFKGECEKEFYESKAKKDFGINR